MNEIRPVDVVVCQSLRGREAPPEGSPKRPKSRALIETPSLPFETEVTKIRRTTIPPRTATGVKRKQNVSRSKKDDGYYAVRFQDGTWAHTDPPTHDHYASRSEIIDVINKFDSSLRTITGSDDIERAIGYQSITDMLLDELSNQLVAECREQSEIVNRARESYASIFLLLQEDGKRCRDHITLLEKRNMNLEENLTKVIDTSTERVREIQEECNRKIELKNQEMESKKEEYDSSMKRFLEQKSQLEEHVKALHRVFLDFQSDSVYITLEDLKQKQAITEKKLRNKEADMSKLNGQIQKLNKRITELEAQKGMVEQANDELRRKLQTSMAQKNRLQRQLEMQGFGENAPSAEEEENDAVAMNLFAQKQQSMSIDNFGPIKNISPSKKTNRPTQIDTEPYLASLQKLGQISDKVTDFVQRVNPQASIPRPYNEEYDKILFSGSSSLMIKAVEKKVDEVLQCAELLDNIDIFDNRPRKSEDRVSKPRFLRYISLYLDQMALTSVPSGHNSGVNLFFLVRQIMQAKYIHDKWCQRINRPLTRLPEFIISFYSKDGESVFASLQKCVRLWHLIEKNKTPEVHIFRKFVTEKLTVDELSFFLETRYALLGLPDVDQNCPAVIIVPFSKCKELLEKVLGAFSPVVAKIIEQSQEFIQEDNIDYAQFFTVFLDFYKQERLKRRNAVRFMFQSKKFTQNGTHVDFENFVAMVKSLGYQGPHESIFDLYREANLLAGGELTLDSLLDAMDSLSFHFYSIEMPFSIMGTNEISSIKREKLVTHWIRFASWFEGFRKPIGSFDVWVKSQLNNQVNYVDKVFKTNSPVSVMFSEYRKLLDFFQFILDILARGQGTMNDEKTERQILLLENLIDLLVTYVVKSPDPNFEFDEHFLM